MPLYNPTILFDPGINGLRLSLASGVPLTYDDQISKTQIFLHPYKSGSISLYTTSSWSLKYVTSVVTKNIGTLTSATNYDIYAYWTGSAVDLEFVAWTNDTTRATALTSQDGVSVKTGDATRRYIGTFRTTSTTTTEDSNAKRFLWNAYNQEIRNMWRTESGSTNWNYTTTATWRQANANTANKIEFVTGKPIPLYCLVHCVAYATSSASQFSVGIGLDSTTAISSTYGTHTGMGLTSSGSTDSKITQATYQAIPPEGYHALNWMEYQTAGTGTTFTSGLYGAQLGSGISGFIMA